METIRRAVELRDGDDFDQEKMTADVARIRDVYRRLGYSDADAKVDVRLLEGREAIDLVYQIEEGEPR